MNFLRTTPLVVLLALAALAGCERQGGSTNEAGTTETEKPISPAKPAN